MTFISYTSANNVTGFLDLVSDRDFEPQVLKSKLYIPERNSNSKKFPSVIIQHGSGKIGNKTWYPELAKKLNEVGIAALIADSYSERSIESTAIDQRQLSGPTRIYDAFSAFKKLQEIEYIDPNRIGITGYSYGGFVSRFAVVKFISDALGGGHMFKASLPVYPGSSISIANLMLTGAKIHYLLGRLDDYTPSEKCLQEVYELKNSGYNVDYTMYDNAHHGFISDNGVQYYPDNITDKNCFGAYLGEDKHIYYEGKRFEKFYDFYDALENGIMTEGVHSGGDILTRNKAMDFTVKFFHENL